MSQWDRGHKLALWNVVVALLGVVATVIVGLYQIPEVRESFKRDRLAGQAPDRQQNKEIEGSAAQPTPPKEPSSSGPERSEATDTAKEPPPNEVPDPPAVPAVSVTQDDSPLITFAVRPADAAIYLDEKFLGISENMTQGVRISRGQHLLTIARYGFQSHESVVVVEDSALVVEVELHRAESSQNQEGLEPAVQNQREANPEPLSTESFAGVKVYLRYRPRREIAALAIEERLKARGINVKIQEDVAPYGDKWNRIYYSECRQEAAQALVKIIGELLSVELVRTPAACGQTLEVVLFS